MVKRRNVWHVIIALRQYTRPDDIGRGMLSSPLDRTYDRTTSGVAFNHRPWAAHTVGWRRAWHAIIALGKQTQSEDIGHGMQSSLLENTYGQMTLGVACHHRFWTAHTVRKSWSWHARMSLRQHTRSNDVGRRMPSSMACYHCPSIKHTVRQRHVWHAVIGDFKKMYINQLYFKFPTILKKIIFHYCYEFDKRKQILEFGISW